MADSRDNDSTSPQTPSTPPEPTDVPKPPQTPQPPADQPVRRVPSREERRAGLGCGDRDGANRDPGTHGIGSDLPLDDDVQDAIDKVTTFWSRYGNTLLWAVVIFCAVILINNVVRNQLTTAHEEAWGNLAGTSTPQGLEQVAESYTARPGVHYQALLDAADLYHAEAIAAEDRPEATGNENAETSSDDAANGTGGSADAEDEGASLSGLGDGGLSRAELIDKARAKYQQVIDDARGGVGRSNAALVAVGVQPRMDLSVYEINGVLGLAAVELTAGAFDAAESAYREAEGLADEAGYVALAEQARVGLERLPQVRQPLVLAPAPPAGRSGQRQSVDINSVDTNSVDIMGPPIEVVPGNETPGGDTGNPFDLAPSGATNDLGSGTGTGSGTGLDLNLDLNPPSGTGTDTDTDTLPGVDPPTTDDAND